MCCVFRAVSQCSQWEAVIRSRKLIVKLRQPKQMSFCLPPKSTVTKRSLICDGSRSHRKRLYNPHPGNSGSDVAVDGDAIKPHTPSQYHQTIRCPSQCWLETELNGFEIVFDSAKPGLAWLTSWMAPVCREAASRCSVAVCATVCPALDCYWK